MSLLVRWQKMALMVLRRVGSECRLNYCLFEIWFVCWSLVKISVSVYSRLFVRGCVVF